MVKAAEIIALDRGSVRSFDADGHLRVEVSNLSKANVCGYRGSEIPDWETLGLDGSRTYRLLRDPAELDAGAASFNGKPLLVVHKPVSAEDHPHKIVAGAIGGDVRFEAPYLRGSLIVWDAAAIAGIQSREQCQLSCAYRYRADMTPGEHDGEPYDGVMRDIRGNHVALVETGRAGSDVVVGDAALLVLPPQAEIPGANRAGFAGATKDPAMATRKTTLKNSAGLRALLSQHLAQDADLEEVVEMIEQVEEIKDALEGVPDDGAPKPVGIDDDGDMVSRVMEFLAGKLSDEDLAALRAVMKPEVDPPAADAGRDDDKDKDKDRDAKQAKDKGVQARDAGRGPPVVTKPAMDSAIKLAVDGATKATIARLNAVRAAERAVRPYIGELVQAPDTADAVFKLALDHLKVNVDGVHPSAYPHILAVQPVPGAAPARPRPIAQDTAGEASFHERFPDANRLKAF